MVDHIKNTLRHSILNSLLSVQKCDIRKISPTKTIDQSQLRNAALSELHMYVCRDYFNDSFFVGFQLEYTTQKKSYYSPQEVVECFETWGAHHTQSQAHTSSLLIFSKCLLHGSSAQTSFFAMSTVSNVSIIDLWQFKSRQLFRRFWFMVLLK